MTQSYYRPPFDKQLTGGPCAHANCNMCASGRLASRLTLGAIERTGGQMRLLSGYPMALCRDPNPDNDGTSLGHAVTALARLGIDVQAFDRNDGKGWGDALSFLKAGRPIVAHGDYDRVPLHLRGDKAFTGYHSVLFNEVNANAVYVWDSLNDGRRANIPRGPIWWPLSVAKAYMDAFPGPYSMIVPPFWRAECRTAGANVRAEPRLASPSLATLALGKRLQRGSHVHGDMIGGNDVWYRVWWPSQVAYIHASVITLLY